jgi:signal recognition particle GTPase
MSDYREMLERGLKGVRELAATGKCTREKAETAFKEYRAIFGIIDAMTPAERLNPVERIDSTRIRRISLGAGVQDRQVIQLLINLSQFNEMILRAELGIIK